jgi:hypothetical protein
LCNWRRSSMQVMCFMDVPALLELLRCVVI